MSNRAEGVSPFGAGLRWWRTHRGLSQLTLAGQAATTARHVSFLETGRSRPNREMVLRLADALEVSPRGRNELLHLAGLPAAYSHSALQAADLAPYRAAIDTALTAHLPFPAMVVDGHTNVVFANDACAALFGAPVVGMNFIRDFLANPAAAEIVANWPEVAWAGLHRLREHLARSPFDQALRDLVGLAEMALSGTVQPETIGPQLTVCPSFRVGGRVIRTVVLAARFDAAIDVTLDELRIELIYPFDQEAEQFFRDAPGAQGRGA